jgi:beta-glucosidase
MSKYPFLDPTLSPERRIDDLLGRMHLDEKIACFGTCPDVPRLGVVGSPHIEGYHGVAQGGPSNWGRQNPTPTTQFPQAYGLGSTWNPETVRRVAEQMAIEARALWQNPDYARGGLVVRAPNADIARDPRWGRTEEVYGEDPFHVGLLSAAFARGLQGDDERYWLCASLLKHFCANSNEDDRTSSSSNFDERLFREYYAWPFDVAVAQGGSRALMAAYNAVNGTPAHIHPMLNEVVKAEWGVDGIICSDGGGLRLLVSDHKAFPDLAAGAAACIKAGINQFLDKYIEPVTEAVERGLLGEADLDAGLRGVFRVMIRLGLLDPPERVPYATIGRSERQRPWEQASARELAREVTRESIVLLENRHGLLPLDRDKVRSIAIVGPRCNEVLFDWYSGMPPYTITPRDGIERVAGPGVSVGWVGDMGPAALELVREREVAIVCIGNHPEGNASWARVSSPSEGKEAVDRKSLALASDQEAFVRQVVAANPDTIVVLLSNFPVALPWVIENARAMLHATHCSQELGTALGDVIFGDYNPGGKLAQTWPRSVEQLPPLLDYDIRNGRTYLYSRQQPQYSFGYGLSYTRFELANVEASTSDLTLGSSVEVSVDVHNTGTRDGDEVVQLYVHHLPRDAGSGRSGDKGSDRAAPDVERPERALKGFRRVRVAAGATQRVSITLRGRDLAYWNAARQRWDLERGNIEVWIGTSSRPSDIALRKTLQVHPDR